MDAATCRRAESGRRDPTLQAVGHGGRVKGRRQHAAGLEGVVWAEVEVRRRGATRRRQRDVDGRQRRQPPRAEHLVELPFADCQRRATLLAQQRLNLIPKRRQSYDPFMLCPNVLWTP